MDNDGPRPLLPHTVCEEAANSIKLLLTLLRAIAQAIQRQTQGECIEK